MSLVSTIRNILGSQQYDTLLHKSGFSKCINRWRTFRNLREPAINPQSKCKYENGILYVDGNWKEIGRKITEAFDVSGDIQIAKNFREGLAQIELQKLDGIIDQSYDYLCQNFGDIADLIEGASYAVREFDFKNVLLAQLWPILVPIRDYHRSCSGVAINSCNGPMLGQNLDLGPTNNVALTYIRPENGPARVCHLLPGTLWLGMGVNEYQVVCGGGSVNVERQFSPTPFCLPTSYFDMAILGSSSSALQAMQMVRSFGSLGPNHDGLAIVGVDKSGFIFRFDASASDYSLWETNSNFAIATNHFSSKELKDLNRASDSISSTMLENSIARTEQAESVLANGSDYNAHDLKKFLRNEKNSGAWNRSARGRDTGWTTASYVFDLGEAKLHYWLGTKPIKYQWRELDLEPLFRKSNQH